MFGLGVNRLGIVSALRDIYGVIGTSPEFVADFTREYFRTDSAASDFDTLFTFTRASTATYVDATGTLQTAASGEPRLGHHVWDGSQWVNEGLLIESEARTNLVTYSEDFTDASWTIENSTLASSTVLAPDNTTFVDLQKADATNTEHDRNQLFSVEIGKTYTASAFFKAGGYNYGLINFSSTRIKGLAFINLSDGSVNSPNLDLTSIQSEYFGNGWWRLSATGTANDTAQTRVRFGSSDDGTSDTFLGDGTSGVYIYGAQFEEGSTPSSYIPTSGSTATRAAETLVAPSSVLPWPDPVVIGDEALTDPSFDNAGAWTALNAEVTGGQAVWSADASGSYLTESGVLESGKVYEVTATVSSYSVGDLKVRLGTSATDAELDIDGAGEFTAVVVADGTAFWLIAVGTTTVTLDNISVREISPLAVSIAMEGRTTFADNDLGAEIKYFEWSADSNNLIKVEYATSFTPSRVRFIQGESGTFDLSNDTSGAFSPGINVPYNIASRHGSTFINGAVDGTALTADTTPTALPDLSSTDLDVAPTYMGTVKTLRIWADDVGDSGIAEASA